ncbi:ABC transporter permease subunit [Clostridium sp. NSJ-49]|jgi:NitT/TauT family transport system permease protein|uniref:ABC transporter n=1 Tax=Clostridium disporicum TaxID=84024 RepID=A0A174LZN6_9CLOT|nr:MULTISPECIES: ABC transporter permease subunit [Clostridium]MBC5627236.1 ABC transporter permease subunit [Clostridium sp. NSJ-49]MCD2503340.1 ABC transporter permease subunit [Clostridium sp. NSJ-145]CUP28441.1 ABC transporter [Clostridium disporicum]
MSTSHYSLKNNKYIIFSIVIILLIWQVTSIYIGNRLLFPSVTDVIKSMIEIVTQYNFITIIFYSIIRGIKSFFISLSVGLILAILSYFNKIVYNCILPILSIIKAVPTMAFIVLLLIWTSKDYAPIIIGIMISLPIFYDVILNTIMNLDKNLLQMCDVYDIPTRDKMKDIIMPIVIIELAKVLSSTFSLIFKVVISGEVYSQPKYGIGAIIQLEKMQLNTAHIISWIIIITIISYVFDLLFKVIDKRYIHKGR